MKGHFNATVKSSFRKLNAKFEILVLGSVLRDIKKKDINYTTY